MASPHQIWSCGRGGRSSYLTKDLNLFVVRTSNYQMPKPMSTMPIANHPTTPTEIIVSSVMPRSDGFGLGFESESADFITRSEISGCRTDGRRNFSKVHAFSSFKSQTALSVKARARSLIKLSVRRTGLVTKLQKGDLRRRLDNHRVSVERLVERRGKIRTMGSESGHKRGQMGVNAGKELPKSHPKMAEGAGQKMFSSTVGRAELFQMVSMLSPTQAYLYRCRRSHSP